MRIYCGCPIDTSRPEHPPAEQIKEIIDIVVEALGDEVVVFNPFAAYANAHLIHRQADLDYVVQINNFALNEADVAVFVWNGSSSYGVPVEIEACRVTQKPFFILNTTGKKLGLYLRHGAYLRGEIVSSKEELSAGLVHFKDTGKVKSANYLEISQLADELRDEISKPSFIQTSE